jgi:tetratricopeptide (TPR) repeat protein/TolB-like protein
VIGRRVGRFLVVSKLGRGGFATVWQARDELLGRTVALKIMDESLLGSAKARRRFLHGAQAAAALEHPGIVAVYETGEADGLSFIALQLVDGETLSEQVARRLLPIDEAVRIVTAVAEALAHAHARDVVHRDVTGRNIMVARDGRVFILDFGLALGAWQSRVTSSQTAVGTAHYMAPEVIQGGRADVRSDLYGLGVVLYEALTGTFPHSGEQPPAVFYSAMNLAPVPPRARRADLPEALQRVVLKAIARDPTERYQTAEDFLAALRVLDLGAGAAPATVLPRAPNPPASESRAPHDRPSDVGPIGSAPTYLAVLPFEAVASTEDPEGACATLASRLAETLSAALLDAPGIHVVPTTGDAPVGEPRQVAAALGANALLHGSVRRSGSQVRVTFGLLDPFRGVQLGGAVVDGSAFRVFDLEDEVVASVRRALGVPPSAAETGARRPPDPVGHERYLQALGYLRRFDNEASVDGAIQLLERLVASQPDVAGYHAALARAYLHKQDRTKERVWENRAAAACERAMALDQESLEVQVARGDVSARCGRFDTALEAFSKALRQRPGCVDAVLGTARALLAAGRLDEAERTCLEAIALEPEDWRGYHRLGRVRYQAGEFARAIEPWRRVVELTPDNALGRRHLGTAFHRLGQLDEAVAAYRESLAIQPNDEAYSNLGTALYHMERYDEAIPALRKATELTPSDPILWGNLGNTYHWLPGFERESEAALERAVGLMRERLERNPAQAESWSDMAGWLANLGHRDAAAVAIRRATDLAPTDVHCMVQAGRVYCQLGDRDACLHWIRAARRAGFSAGELLRSRDLASLREDPEFLRIIEEAPDNSPTPEADVPSRGSTPREMRRASGSSRSTVRGKGAAPMPHHRRTG